ASISSSCSNAPVMVVIVVLLLKMREISVSAGLGVPLGLPLDPLEERRPAARESLAEGLGHEAERQVPEGDERPAVDLGEPILHVRDDRRRHEERTGDLEQRRPLDGLDMAPEMAVAVAEIAEPAAAWMGLDDHRQRFAIGRFVGGPNLLEQRV